MYDSVDLARIDELIDWAEAEEAKGEMSEWNQEDWVTDDAPCGTAYCIAGKVVSEAGYRLVLNSQGTAIVVGSKTPLPYIADQILGLSNGARDGFDLSNETLENLQENSRCYDPLDLYVASNSVNRLKHIRDNYALLSDRPLKYRDAE